MAVNRDMHIHGDYCPASLVEVMNAEFNERLSLKNKVKKDQINSQWYTRICTQLVSMYSYWNPGSHTKLWTWTLEKDRISYGQWLCLWNGMGRQEQASAKGNVRWTVFKTDQSGAYLGKDLHLNLNIMLIYIALLTFHISVYRCVHGLKAKQLWNWYYLGFRNACYKFVIISSVIYLLMKTLSHVVII